MAVPLSNYLELSLHLAEVLNNFSRKPDTSKSYFNTLVPPKTKQEDVFSRVLSLTHDPSHNLWSLDSKFSLAFRVSYANIQKTYSDLNVGFSLFPYSHYHLTLGGRIIEVDPDIPTPDIIETQISFFQLYQLDVLKLISRSDKPLREVLFGHLNSIKKRVSHLYSYLDTLFDVYQSINKLNIPQALDNLYLFYRNSSPQDRYVCLSSLPFLILELTNLINLDIPNIAFSPVASSISSLIKLVSNESLSFADLDKATKGGWFKIPYRELSAGYLDFITVLMKVVNFRKSHPMGPPPKPFSLKEIGK